MAYIIVGSSYLLTKVSKPMTPSCLGALVASTAPVSHRLVNRYDLDALRMRTSLPIARPSGVSRQGLKIHASAGTADAPAAESSRPPCFQEVWPAPEQSRLIKDKRAFLEEHR